MNLNNNTDYWIKQELLNEDRLDAYYYSKEFIDFDKHISQICIKTIKIDTLYKVIDGDHGSVEYSDKGVVFLRAQNIMDGYIDYDNAIYISESQHKKSKRSMIYKDDLLLSIMASTGVSAVFSKDVACNANRAVGILRNYNEEVVDNYYVVALINSDIGKIIFERGIRGSIQKRLNLADINDLNIPIPSTEIQKYIGDKVRKAEELREEAKRFKKEAEEVFDECLEISKLYKKILSIQSFNWVKETLIDDRVDMKFNSPSMISIYNHLKSFECFHIKNEFQIFSGYSFSSGDFSDFEGEKVIKIGDINNNFIDASNLRKVRINQSLKIKVGKIVCSEENLIYAMTGATIGKVAMYVNDDVAYLNQRVACIKSKGMVPTGYLFLFLSSKIGRELSYNLSSGVAQPNISLDEIESLIIPKLDDSVMMKIHEYVIKSSKYNISANNLIKQAKQDIEDLIEGNFDMSKIKESN